MARGMAAVEMAKSPEEYGSAMREFQEASRLAPDWPDPHYNLGLVQEKSGKFREAVASLKEYLRLTPDAPDASNIKELIYKLKYKAEQVLSVSDIVDVLVSFSNWEKAGGRCVNTEIEIMNEVLASIKRKDNNSVEYSTVFHLGGYGPDMRLAVTKKIEGHFFKMMQIIFCTSPGQNDCWFRCDTEIEVVSKTHVKVRLTMRDVEKSPIKALPRNDTYVCEYRKA